MLQIACLASSCCSWSQVSPGSCQPALHRCLRSPRTHWAPTLCPWAHLTADISMGESWQRLLISCCEQFNLKMSNIRMFGVWMDLYSHLVQSHCNEQGHCHTGSGQQINSFQGTYLCSSPRGAVRGHSWTICLPPISSHRKHRHPLSPFWQHSLKSPVTVIDQIPTSKAAVSNCVCPYGPELLCSIQNISHMPQFKVFWSRE